MTEIILTGIKHREIRVGDCPGLHFILSGLHFLSVNLKVAKTLRLTIPETILMRANEVIR